MKKILIVLLIFFCFWSCNSNMKVNSNSYEIAKTEDCNSNMYPASGINEQSASDRINVYRTIKRPALEKLINKPEINSIDYSPKGFLSLLQKITTTSGNPPDLKYNGLRVYFGVDVKTDKMTLIFVPTIGGILSGRPVSTDDTSNCLIIIGDTAVNILVKNASDCITKFNKERWPYFTSDGISHNHDEKYVETKTLLYDIRDICATGNKPFVGLITYLTCLINNNSINTVTVDFAAYTLAHNYQLTLLFNFSSSSNNNFIYLAYAANQSMAVTDTGIPCPPPPDGSTCPGTLLPKQ